MRFSIYSEIQYWGGKSPEARVRRGDRAGRARRPARLRRVRRSSSTSSSRSSRSRPTRSRSGASAPRRRRTSSSGRSGTSCRTTTRRSWPRRSRSPAILFDGPLRVRRAARPRLDSRPRPACRSARRATATRSRSTSSSRRSATSAFSYDGTYYHDRRRARSGRGRRRKFRVFLGGTSDRTYELAAKHGWAVVVPPLLPYAALKDQLDLYRAKCAEHGTEPDIVWIHACYIDEDRDTARREAERGMRQFLEGNASPLDGRRPPPAERGHGGVGLRLLHLRDHGEARRRRRTTR